VPSSGSIPELPHVAEVGDYDDERMDTIFDALSYFAPFGSENTPMDLH
jgi:hypothetical protein